MMVMMIMLETMMRVAVAPSLPTVHHGVTIQLVERPPPALSSTYLVKLTFLTHRHDSGDEAESDNTDEDYHDNSIPACPIFYLILNW